MSCESKINVPVCHFVIDQHVNSWNKLFIVNGKEKKCEIFMSQQLNITRQQIKILTSGRI
jgi:hypothetical protein